jgi:hypothetical protein
VDHQSRVIKKLLDVARHQQQDMERWGDGGPSIHHKLFQQPCSSLSAVSGSTTPSRSCECS